MINEKVWYTRESHFVTFVFALYKTMSSGYHMEQKTFIEASCISIIHTGEKFLRNYCIWRFVSRFCPDSKKTSRILWSVWLFFAFLDGRRKIWGGRILEQKVKYSTGKQFDIWRTKFTWKWAFQVSRSTYSFYILDFLSELEITHRKHGFQGIKLK